jgi:16S rRNA (guanine527-N7)-methyltransferase
MTEPKLNGNDLAADIQGLAERYGLPGDAPDRLTALMVILAKDPFAPTAVRGGRRAVDDHLADSLVALELQQTRLASKLADLGSGAGFPGLPLAIALPDAAVTLVESSARKCAFIARATDACGIENVTVLHARAESWRQGVGELDLVTARALAPLPVVAEYAAPLLQVGGNLLVWRGRRNRDEEAAGARAALELGLESREPQRVHPYAGALHRHLQLMSKIRPTPDRFPRRPGMARKHPLGGSTPVPPQASR